MKKTSVFKVLAIAGVFTTGYLTAIAVPYLEDYKEELIATLNFSKNDEEKLEARKNFLTSSIKVLLPAIGSAAAKVASIIFLDKEHVKLETAVMAQLYCALDAIKQAKELGVSFTPKFETYDIPKARRNEILVYEPYTDQIFPTTEKLIEKAMDKGNKRLNNYYFETLNRFLKDIGGKTCAFGDILGWSCDKEYQMEKWKEDGPYLSVKLTPQDVNGRDIYIMDYDVNPLWL